MLLGSAPLPPLPEPPPPSQIQVARQFLLAVLGGQTQAAYRLLTPAAQARLPADRFAAAVQPLYAEGQQRGPTIDLYKFGLRLGDVDTQAFCTFMFRSDTAATAPQVQLDVTFETQEARQIQDFGLVRPAAPPAR